MTPTEYRNIPCFAGYRVGDDGSVWTSRSKLPLGMGRGSRAIITNRWRRLKPYRQKNGYLKVKLGNRPATYHLLHRLVLLAFRGPCPEGLEASHLNGIRDDCRAINLTWETSRENNRRKREHGTQPFGRTHYRWGKQ